MHSLPSGATPFVTQLPAKQVPVAQGSAGWHAVPSSPKPVQPVILVVLVVAVVTVVVGAAVVGAALVGATVVGAAVVAATVVGVALVSAAVVGAAGVEVALAAVVLATQAPAEQLPVSPESSRHDVPSPSIVLIEHSLAKHTPLRQPPSVSHGSPLSPNPEQIVVGPCVVGAEVVLVVHVPLWQVPLAIESVLQISPLGLSPTITQSPAKQRPI